MLDVDPPQKRVRGVTEFFLFTITIGLLIALALENAAGAFHHRHQQQAAMADVRVTMAHLGARRDFSGGLLKSYDEALK
jgi:hypothetical protein